MRRGQTALVHPLSSDLPEVSSWHLVGEHIPLVEAHLSLRPPCLRDLLPLDSDRKGPWEEQGQSQKSSPDLPPSSAQTSRSLR